MKAWLLERRFYFALPLCIFINVFNSAPPIVKPVRAVAPALQLAGRGAWMSNESAGVSNPEITEQADDIAEAYRVRAGLRVTDFEHKEWHAARPIRITRYWSGAEAPPGRHAEARVVWDDEALSVRFVYRQAEPPVVSGAPRTDKKTIGLWERDVCEVFLAPDAKRPEKYFEFEAAPTGEWLDLAILWRPDERETDWDYRSGMEAATRTTGDKVTIMMRVPWTAFGRKPEAGERWRANFFRCAGADPTRGYMSWRPTRTPEPGFHVPQAFGELNFRGRKKNDKG